MQSERSSPSCLISLPGGLGVSGVARFAVRLANGLADRGGRVGLLLHAANPSIPRLQLPIDARVTVVDCGDLPPIEDAEPGRFVDRYSTAIEDLGGGSPVALVLGQHAGPFAVAAELTRTRGDAIRAIGVAHSDNGYDTCVLGHYEPMLHAMVGVSKMLTTELSAIAPNRASAIERVAYGVEVPSRVAAREPIGGRPLRLLYAGRLEHRQKRVLALPALSHELERRGIAHEMTIIGDGPAIDDLRVACSDASSITIRPPATPEALAEQLDAHDAFVLPSRFEGLSIAMLEALAHGCIPVVAPSRSGTAEAVLPGRTGEIASVTPDDEEPRVGIALADAIETLRRRDLDELSKRCHAHALASFSIEHHVDRWSSLIGRVAEDAPRPWPTNRPVSFEAASGTGSVPADAPQRFARVVDRLGGAPIALHGAGAHTRALADAVRHANVVCITDDDRQRHGEAMLGVPIVDPSEAATLGATHVVISTHLHEAEVWRRRAVYERQGLTVHRLYADGP
ncbi:MAG: glycosyltransferase family 4 protein [Planctomycetota bacterium]